MIRLSFLLSFVYLFLSHELFAQVSAVPPAGTTVTPSSGVPFAYALTGGLSYNYTNSSWPAFNTNCYAFTVNDTLFSAINGFNPTPSGGACSGMSNLVYNSGMSNLASGVIVYTGTTAYRYRNISNAYVVNNTIPVRATITFSGPVIYYSNNTFVLPVTGNFTYSVLFESFSPTDAQYTSGSGNVWTPSKTLFNNLVTDPNNSICVNFTPGSFTLNTVTASTAPSGIICQGGNIQLTGGGTGNNLTFNWTGPNSFNSAGSNVTINNASISNSGNYFLTATDDIGCPNTAQSVITVQQAPTATAGGTSLICVNNSATVSGATSSNGTISWTHNGSGSLSNGNTLTPTYTPSSSDAGNTVVLTLITTSNNSCAPATAQASYNIIVEGNPIATDGVTSAVCSTTNFTVTTANAQFGTINWTHNGSGTLINANTASPTYIPSPLDDGNTVVLTLTVTSNNLCAPGTAQAFHILNITPLPQAVSGGVATVCQNGSLTVTGAVANYGTISWSHNGSGSLANPTTINPTYTPNAGDVGNIVTLTMTVSSNNACAPAIETADFTISVQGLPTISITNSSTICSNSTATVSGVSASNGTILWTHNGSGSLSNSTTLTPTYTPSTLDAGNAVSLTITVSSNNSCAPVSASAIYTVNVNRLPVAVAGNSVTICESNPYTVTGASFNYGTANWVHNGSGSIINGTTNSPSYIPGPTDAGNAVTLTLNVTSNNACAPYVSSSQLFLNIQHAPIALAGGSTTVCVTSTAPVTGATATYGTINWTHNGGGTLSNPTTLGPVYTPVTSDAGNSIILTLTVTSTNGCAPQTASATYTIHIDPLPLAAAGGSDTICATGSGTVSGATAAAGTAYWTSNGLGSVSDPTTITPTYFPTSAESGSTVTLTMELLSNNSCFPASSYATYTFFIESPPSIQVANPMDTLCPGATKLIEGVTISYGTPSWTHNGTGTLVNGNTNSPSYTAGPGDVGNTVSLTLTVTSNNSCAPQTAVSVIQVYVEASANIPTIHLIDLNHVLCYGDHTGSVILDVTGGAPPYTYNWSSGSTSQNLINAREGIYYLNVADNHGCFALDTFKINQPTELVDFPWINPIDCFNETAGSISVSASGGVGPYTYFWPDLNSNQQILSGVPTGHYHLTIKDANGCVLNETLTLSTTGNLTVEATPEVMSVNIGTEIPFSVTGATTYLWTPAQYLSCDECDNPVCVPSSTNNYVVVGSNPDGCIGTDTVRVTVYVDCHNLTLPNIFSPNNSGPEINNTFGLLGTLPCLETYQLLIFNRWGEQVFETQSTELVWDGTFKGTPQNSGVYFYRLDMKLVNGEVIKKAGNLTLVR
ncbi:gliding motility-associated C-terminal domain-containing protein [Fluviicola chungangensis]|uniref:T9SS type B sorting domain-containing protein n=1 Tax=Fluviicola chungangensis TaxID=2597671 RepID=A0A556MGP0_9FLAO|nr:gliding motility-associated C-terminal domain-containing protein [Fluviicola chungangensis]TSJ39111.1 T9SS type B sorting domain-containing protein [Fluviicola chungangensis]